MNESTCLAVSSRTTIPVLKGILLNVKEDKVILTSSNLDMSIRREIDAVVEEEGSAVAAAKLFGEIIRKLPNETVFIESNDSDILSISTSSSSFQVLTLPVEFDASARALKLLQSGFILDEEETAKSRKVLTAAAMTYVASAASAVIQLLRLMMIVGGGSRRRD